MDCKELSEQRWDLISDLMDGEVPLERETPRSDFLHKPHVCQNRGSMEDG